MDALDHRKLSGATAYDNAPDNEKAAIQKQLEHAPPAVKEALAIVNAKDVSRTEVLRVRNAAFTAAVAAAPLQRNSKESRMLYFFCFVTLYVIRAPHLGG
jgi:hypothetical protein